MIGPKLQSGVELHPDRQQAAHLLSSSPLLSVCWSPGQERSSAAAAAAASPPDMAQTDGADMTEETQYMIDKNLGKEPDTATESQGDAKEMRAVVMAGFGGLNKLRVTKKPMPDIQDGEVKIRVKAW